MYEKIFQGKVTYRLQIKTGNGYMLDVLGIGQILSHSFDML
jgi:hypothetical protein